MNSHADCLLLFMLLWEFAIPPIGHQKNQCSWISHLVTSIPRTSSSNSCCLSTCHSELHEATNEGCCEKRHPDQDKDTLQQYGNTPKKHHQRSEQHHLLSKTTNNHCVTTRECSTHNKLLFHMFVVSLCQPLWQHSRSYHHSHT